MRYCHVELYDDDGNLDHSAVVSDLTELFRVANGRRIEFAGSATEAEYESHDNQIAIGNKVDDDEYDEG